MVFITNTLFPLFRRRLRLLPRTALVMPPSANRLLAAARVRQTRQSQTLLSPSVFRAVAWWLALPVSFWAHSFPRTLLELWDVS
jgi:hypothetical protein